MRLQPLTIIAAVLVATFGFVTADLPIHCLASQVAGDWEFELSAATSTTPDMCGYQQPDKNEHHFQGRYTYELKSASKITVSITAPNVAKIGDATGKWTMIYDEGFLVQAGGMEFFAFSDYKPKKGTILSNLKPENYISFCDRTRIGWYNKDGKYGCWKGRQLKPAYPDVKITNITNNAEEVTTAVVAPTSFIEKSLDQLFDPDYSFIELNNKDPESLWVARAHGPFLALTERDMLARVGGRSYLSSPLPRGAPSPQPSAEEDAAYAADLQDGVFLEELTEIRATAESKPVSFVDASAEEELDMEADADADADVDEEGEMDADDDDEDIVADASAKSSGLSFKKPPASNKTCEYGLPCSFDWRNQKGRNWLSSIRNQGSCGSCYAMAFTTVLESRVRIKMNQPNRHRYSTQHVVSCSQMNQGCKGGFPELVGLHVEQLGAVPESCFPYEAKDGTCSNSCRDKPEYPIKNTRYVGGYLGATNEEKIMRELAEGGPVVIAFESPRTLFSYHGGIFTGPRPRAEDLGTKDLPVWQHTNHAVVAVGWGHTVVRGKRVKYWIMRNTWGKHWGEDGYFRIRRGTDECGIESMAVSFDIKDKF